MFDVDRGSATLGVAIVALAACSPSAPVPDGAASAEPSAPSPAASSAAVVVPAASVALTASHCRDDGTPYGVDELRARVTFLASAELDGRVPGTEGDRAARAHIVERFRCLGLKPGGVDGSYEQPFDQTANVVGLVAGTDPVVGSQIVLVGAHHDHEGKGHLGANDNASGVASLLAIAQAAKRAAPPRRTIAFVTFGAEERGLKGSKHFVANPPPSVDLDRVVEMVNLDMVGSHASTRSVSAYGTFAKLPSRAIVDELRKGYPKLTVHVGAHSGRTDHVPFCKRGIPYVFFWTPDNACYHRVCDKADRLDYPRMADIASLAGALVQRLADTPTDLAAAKARWGCGTK